MNKEEELKNALIELEKAISDIKEKYGKKIDTEFLQKKFEEIINISNGNEK